MDPGEEYGITNPAVHGALYPRAPAWGFACLPCLPTTIITTIIPTALLAAVAAATKAADEHGSTAEYSHAERLLRTHGGYASQLPYPHDTGVVDGYASRLPPPRYAGTDGTKCWYTSRTGQPGQLLCRAANGRQLGQPNARHSRQGYARLARGPPPKTHVVFQLPPAAQPGILHRATDHMWIADGPGNPGGVKALWATSKGQKPRV